MDHLGKLRVRLSVEGLPPVATGVAVGVLVLAPCLFVSGTLYVRGVRAIHEEIRGNTLRVASAAAILVDPELHKTFTDPAQEQTPEYSRAIEPLGELVNSSSDFKYVYTYVVREGKVYFVLDPTPAGDSDQDGVDDKSHVMEHYDEDGIERMLQSFREGVPIAEHELDSDQWGTFLSAYAPVFDSHGKVVACVGVDVAADKYALRLSSIKGAGVAALVVSVLISVLVGTSGCVVQLRRQQFLREQEAAKQELEELARSLDVANGQLRFANRRFEQLFNLVPVACFTFDAEGTVYDWNRECELLTGWKAHEIAQKTLFETVVKDESQPEFRRMIEQVFKGRPSVEFEWTTRPEHRARFTVLVNAYPLTSPDGKVTGGIAALADITVRKDLQTQVERQIAEVRAAYAQLDASRNHLSRTNVALTEANKLLMQLATIDGLTNVLNRRAVFDNLERAMSVAKRTGRPLSILMLDIDQFKELNDTHGHVTGDNVLKGVANQLVAACRLEDEVGRFGGEEFLVILPETSADKAVQVAQRVRKRIAATDFGSVSCTVSVGVSSLGEGIESSERFIDSADRALYEAKRAGRNRVVHSRDLKEGAA